MKAALAAAAALLAATLTLVTTVTVDIGDHLAGLADAACAVPELPTTLAEQGVTDQMLANATTIVTVGQQMQVPRRGMVIAVATALQESGLRNLDHGDRDSLGLFQQRPSQGWGTPDQILNPAYAARQFYRHLLAIPGWARLPLTVAAQAVQHSAFGDAYATWQQLASAIVDTILGACMGSATSTTDPVGQKIVMAAQSQLGQPYVFDGGDANGPTRGTTPGIGFDCSGLALYAYAQAGIGLPHSSRTQSTLGAPVTAEAAQPGDLVFFHTDGPPGTASHVGIYLGGYRMIHAPDVGQTVTTTSITTNYWQTRLLGYRHIR